MAASPSFVCFGELLIRLNAPGRELLLQTPRLDAHIGGAEANVAVSLARFGDHARMASVVADNPLGQAALGELRRHGVDAGGVNSVEGRMGLYFLTAGAVQRPSEVLYDRAASAFADFDPKGYDWDAVLDGADWLHLSGVTPAVGPKAAEAALAAVEAAQAKGVKISFDGNYRAQLWRNWGGDGPRTLKRILEKAHIAFINERDIALVLGARFEGDDEAAQRRQAYVAAFKAFPNLAMLAATFRVRHGVDRHELSGLMARRDGASVSSRAHLLDGIVDRIGGGDAFAAGLLHGLAAGDDDQKAIDFAVAASALKHSIPGDFNLVSARQVEEAMAGEASDVRR